MGPCQSSSCILAEIISSHPSGRSAAARENEGREGDTLSPNPSWELQDVVRFWVDRHEKDPVTSQRGLISHLQVHVATTPIKIISAKVDVASEEDDYTALMCAASYGHTDLCRLLLQQYGASVNAQNSQGLSALHAAAAAGHRAILELLLEHEAEVDLMDAAGWNAYLFAVVNKHASCVKVLVEHGSSTVSLVTRQGDTVLHLASGEDNVEELRRIKMQRNPDLLSPVNNEGNSCVHVASMCDAPMALRYLLDLAQASLSALAYLALFQENAIGLCPIHLSLRSAREDCLRTLIERGQIESANRNGLTVLHHCISPTYDLDEDHVGQVGPVNRGAHLQTILEYCREKKDTGLVNRADHRGTTALHLASSMGASRVVVQLLQAGASVTTRCKARGRTPLHLAALAGHTECCQLLAEAGSALDELDADDYTALLLSVSNRGSAASKAVAKVDETPPATPLQSRRIKAKSVMQALPGTETPGAPLPDCSSLLLSLGATASFKTPTGATLLHVAVRHNDVGAVRFLLKHARRIGLDVNALSSSGGDGGETALHEAIVFSREGREEGREEEEVAGSLPVIIAMLLSCDAVDPSIVAEVRVRGLHNGAAWTGTPEELAQTLGMPYAAAFARALAERKISHISRSASRSTLSVIDYGAIYAPTSAFDDIPAAEDASPSRADGPRSRASWRQGAPNRSK